MASEGEPGKSIATPWCMAVMSGIIRVIKMQPARVMTVKEYADFRGVHRNTVMRWIYSKQIVAEQTAGKRGRYSIPVETAPLTHLGYPGAIGWPKKEG